jgi:hypothetical protein
MQRDKQKIQALKALILLAFQGFNCGGIIPFLVFD